MATANASSGVDVSAFPASPTSGIVGPSAAPGGGRGFMVQLGKLTGINLNAVAQTTIFTTPASGFTRCVIYEVILDNSSGTPTTNAISFGASATPTDWNASVVIAAGLTANKSLSLYPAVNVAGATYGAGIAFVANVTAGGAAITCDATVWGYYY